MKRLAQTLRVFAPTALVLVSPAAAGAVQTAVDIELFSAMEARSIGPAGMSGRVAAVASLPGRPNTIWVGAATGGLWKTDDGGMGWRPLFDDQPVASIGAIAVFEKSPDVLWVGTGEGNPRNSASVGNGVYRSLDGGESWRHLGLENSERIHRILLDPDDPDVAYVAALGTSWGENEQRGVFRTRDGGESWEKILYVDMKTGCADLAMAPDNPRKLVAAMWEHRRWPHFFRSGGPGSGLYVSVDGGETWEQRTPEDGLPEGELGRIGVAFAHSQPNVVYALVEAEKSALLRSSDGGRTWNSVNSEPDIAQRPFYYADIRVDPADPDRVYNLASVVRFSDDGGRSFEELMPWSLVHPDHHALWIDPGDPRRLIDGNDGGVAISNDRGSTWRFVRNLPLAQFYHLTVDRDQPYNVYGGLQDNGSWRGPGVVWENGGIRNHHWAEVAFGDGFATVPLPGDSMQGYAMSQGGNLVRWDQRTGERKVIRPDAPNGVRLRFNWNAGIALDPLDADTVYYGSQFVHKSTDRGDSWSVISPDLTTDNPEWQKQWDSGGLTPDVTEAENYTSILTIAPSAVDGNVIWVGTDDGRVHVTRDGGGAWTSVEANLPNARPNTWVAHIEASKFDAGEAFAVLDDHRRANWETYVFHTTDYGATWSNLATGNIEGYAHVIEQDPIERRLLFLGTEFGLYVSWDAGASWRKWTHGVPTVGVRALVVQPREHDLVLGTHGRAAFVLDDVRPLRAFAAGAVEGPLHLFEIGDAQQYRVRQTGESRFPGSEEFRGQNREYGALIAFWLEDDALPHPDADLERARKERERASAGGAREEDDGGDDDDPQVTLEVLDSTGSTLRTLRADAHQGLNRIAWDLSSKGSRRPPSDDVDADPDEEPAGPEVVPGEYRVRVSYGEASAEQSVRVLPDPRRPHDADARRARFEAEVRVDALQGTLTAAVERLHATARDIEAVLAKAEQESKGEDGEHAALVESGRALEKSLERLEDKLWTPPRTKGIPARVRVDSKISRARYGISSSWDRPTPAQLAHFEEARNALAAALAELNAFYENDVAPFRAAVEASGLRLLPEHAPLEVP